MSYQKLSRDQIAERVAQDIPDGAYVNLGIGLPTKISKYLPTDKDVFLHSENGLLAFGPPPAKGEEASGNGWYHKALNISDVFICCVSSRKALNDAVASDHALPVMDT